MLPPGHPHRFPQKMSAHSVQPFGQPEGTLYILSFIIKLKFIIFTVSTSMGLTHIINCTCLKVKGPLLIFKSNYFWQRKNLKIYKKYNIMKMCIWENKINLHFRQRCQKFNGTPLFSYFLFLFFKNHFYSNQVFKKKWNLKFTSRNFYKKFKIRSFEFV